ncbi:hypothetical protein [Actinomycetospora succinea]|uniref:hypothetical protein n=1 Tax=Actinomycetospora succinea TaxID=663603 RepID=UPI001060E357|nr:hypothetical protein [Actinomycetospora succinea]
MTAAPVLASLQDLPGLAHALVTDTDPDGHDRRVVDEIGTDEGTAAAVLAWGRRAAAVAGDRDLALDDVIVTTDTAHHLLRAVGVPATGWVYLRVRRDDGNLALARRRLAALTSPQAPAASRPPVPAGPAELPAGPSSTSASADRSRGPSPALSATPSAAPPGAARSNPWPDRVPPPIRPPAASPTSTSTGPATSTAATVRGAPAALPAPPAPPSISRPPAQAPAPPAARPWAPRPDPAPAPSRDTSAAPPPTRELPATVPELPWPRRPPAASDLPAGPIPEPADAELPKDSAGVLGQRWRSDPETLRRVLAGLLRMGRTPQAALAGSPEKTTTRSPGATPIRRNP